MCIMYKLVSYALCVRVYIFAQILYIVDVLVNCKLDNILLQFHMTGFIMLTY